MRFVLKWLRKSIFQGAHDGINYRINPAARPLRHAIIGLGAGIVSAHLPAIQELDNVVVVGGADVNAATGQARADELDCPFYTDHRQLLAEVQPDITIILTPHPFHAAIAIDALNAGSHVLVEKPMAVQVAEADAMIAAAKQNNRLIAVNFQQRFRPEVEAARQLIENGQLGEIQRVTQVEPWLRTVAYYKSAGWRGTWKGEGGGVLMNQAPHSLDLLCHLAGMPKRVVAWNRTLRHSIEVEDTSMAMLEWENGALGSIFLVRPKLVNVVSRSLARVAFSTSAKEGQLPFSVMSQIWLNISYIHRNALLPPKWSTRRSLSIMGWVNILRSIKICTAPLQPVPLFAPMGCKGVCRWN
ncbi:MAG: Gfo/Idh/MocA family oxidoreductase [Caldilineaceae bacterium]